MGNTEQELQREERSKQKVQRCFRWRVTDNIGVEDDNFNLMKWTCRGKLGKGEE